MSTGDSLWEGGMELGAGHGALSDNRNQSLSVQGISWRCLHGAWFMSNNQTVLAWRAAGAGIVIPGRVDERVGYSDFIWGADAWPCDGGSADPFLSSRRRFSIVKVWGWLSTMFSYPSEPPLRNTWTFCVGKCCKNHKGIYGWQWAADLPLLFQPVLSLLCLPRIFEHKRVVSSTCCSIRQLKD